jgi:hypothetical protein
MLKSKSDTVLRVAVYENFIKPFLAIALIGFYPRAIRCKPKLASQSEWRSCSIDGRDESAVPDNVRTKIRVCFRPELGGALSRCLAQLLAPAAARLPRAKFLFELTARVRSEQFTRIKPVLGASGR